MQKQNTSIKTVVFLAVLVIACGNLCAMDQRVLRTHGRFPDTFDAGFYAGFYAKKAYKNLHEHFHPVVSRQYHDNPIQVFLDCIDEEYNVDCKLSLFRDKDVVGAAPDLCLLFALCAVEMFDVPIKSLEHYTVASELCDDLLAIFLHDFSREHCAWLNQLLGNPKQMIQFVDDWIEKASSLREKGVAVLDQETAQAFKDTVASLCDAEGMEKMIEECSQENQHSFVAKMVQKHFVFAQFFTTGDTSVQMLNVLRPKLHIPVMKNYAVGQAAVCVFRLLSAFEDEQDPLYNTTFRDEEEALDYCSHTCRAKRIFADDEEEDYVAMNERLGFITQGTVDVLSVSSLLGAFMENCCSVVIITNVFAHEPFEIQDLPEQDGLCKPIFKQPEFAPYKPLVRIFVSLRNEFILENRRHDARASIINQFVLEHRHDIKQLDGEGFVADVKDISDEKS